MRVPGYDRNRLRPGVVHLSVGAFHRSHQAVYFDDLAALGHRDWGILGVGLRRPAMRDALRAQDGLYTLLTRGAGGEEARIIGSLTHYLRAPDRPEAVLAAMAAPTTRLVTLTITGGAYTTDAEAGDDEGDDERLGRACAVTYLVEALDRRRRAGRAPFTVLSCDNLPSNGEAARDAVLAHARKRDDRLAEWIDERVAFPNSMVDRITPRTTLADRELLARRFGVRDLWPVVAEPFSQWIVEDHFSDGRPPLDEVGVRFVEDVAPYALMKTRLLNATHCAIGFLGSLAGLRRADEVVREPLLRSYVSRLMADEITPLLPEVPGVDLAAYERTLLERLANPRIGDELQRLCRNGSSKMPSHVLPTLAAARACGSDDRLLTLALAAWLQFIRFTEATGLTLDDPQADRLQALVAAGGEDPRPLLAQRDLFGPLADDEELAATVQETMTDFAHRGVRGAVAGCLAGDAALAA